MRAGKNDIIPVMLRRVIPVIAVAALLSCGAAFAFTFVPVAAVQTLVIHACGAATGQHASGAVTPQPSTPPTSPAPSTLPASSAPPATLSLPGLVSPVSNNTKGSAPSPSAPDTGGGIGYSRGRGHSDGSVSVDQTSGRKVAVALLDGSQIAATRLRLGLHDVLTVKNGKTVVAVALTQIVGMAFGEKELGRLAVTVNMVDGSVLKGNVYPGMVFEIEGKGRVTATRAEEIATIRFPEE